MNGSNGSNGSNDDTLGKLGYVESFGGGGKGIDTPDGGGRRFYGKYRGTVLNNVDPYGQARLLVRVTDVLGLFNSSWATPCLPVAGLQFGAYVIPPVNAGVWVEFEQGDPDRPIWVGCYWGSPAEPPATTKTATPAVPLVMTLSIAQSGMVISDTPVPPMIAGGVMLKSGISFVTVSPDGVTITAPKVEINGLLLVNKTALVVTP